MNRPTAARASIDGHVEPGWSAVADAFRRNFDVAGELGAAVSVFADGDCVVDLWGGTADIGSGRPWERDTVVPTFSTTKGVAAVALHMLVDRGLLDIDAPVAAYWPEFAQAGKERVTVRQVVSHQAGLPFVDADLTLDDLLDHQPVVDALEAQTPHWEPGTAFAYHAVTFGHLVSEIIHRVTGRRLGRFFADEIVHPLGISAWIGLPEDEPVDLARLDRVERDIPPLVAELMGPGSRWARAISLGSALPADLVTGEPGDFNDRRVLSAELGGSDLVCDARSLAKIYAAAVRTVDGVRLLTDEAIRRMIEPQTTDVPYFGWPEPFADMQPFQFCLGMGVMDKPLSEVTFGAGGAGGSFGMGDLEHGIGFGYVMNRMDVEVEGEDGKRTDPRATSLVEAVRACLG